MQSARGLRLGNSIARWKAGTRQNLRVECLKYGTPRTGRPTNNEMNAVPAHNINYELIPQDCTDLHAALSRAGFPIANLLSEILSDTNLSESFDYVISHLDTAEQRANIGQLKIKCWPD